MSTHALWDFGNKDHLVESIRELTVLIAGVSLALLYGVSLYRLYYLNNR